MVSSNKLFGLSGMVKEKLIQNMLDKSRILKSEPVELRIPAHKNMIHKNWYNFNMFSDYKQICLQKDVGKELNIQSPFFRLRDGMPGSHVNIEGQQCINYSSYNYLGLNGNARVSQAAIDAIDKYGTSVSGSRITSGEREIHRALERELAKVHGTEDCVTFVSGHATNVTTIGYLFGPNDLILYDVLSHNSIVQGVLLSGAQRKIFKHNDFEEVDLFLTEQRMNFEKILIVVEGLYSMDGDFPDLAQFVKIKNQHKALLMVDEAHSFGVLGAKGCGIAELFSIDAHEIDICMGTLSKSLASAGGYIAGNGALIEMLRTYAPGFLYSVGMSPPNTAAALAALQLMQEEPERVARLRKNGLFFLQQAAKHGINTGLSKGYAIIPVIIGSSIKASRLANALVNRGISTQPIIYPGVEEKLARIRFFISSEHTEVEIKQTIEILAEELKRLGII